MSLGETVGVGSIRARCGLLGLGCGYGSTRSEMVCRWKLSPSLRWLGPGGEGDSTATSHGVTLSLDPMAGGSFCHLTERTRLRGGRNFSSSGNLPSPLSLSLSLSLSRGSSKADLPATRLPENQKGVAINPHTYHQMFPSTQHKPTMIPSQ